MDYSILANGLRTDHPIPDLPFVDDSHLPVDDGEALEAVGRNKGGGMWGRHDPVRSHGWVAFTTDPYRHDLGWAVRYHPEHGRSVVLLHDKDASGLHTDWDGRPLLFRAGGYWWDGETWYRPDQVIDWASEEYVHRPVRSAVTVSAADLLDDSADPARGRIEKVSNFDATTVERPSRWLDDLALWAARRKENGGDGDLTRSVVKLSAPELAGDQLLGVPEMAQLGEIAASTLRAYVARGQGDVPTPQATVGGRSLWSRPVAEDWAEQRRRSPEQVAASMASGKEDSLSRGESEVRDRFSRSFAHYLWDRPERRKRWVLRHRNEESVREVADELAWEVAASMERLVPSQMLGTTIRCAFLNEFREDIEREEKLKEHRRGSKGARKTSAKPREWRDWEHIGVTRQLGKMLDWFVRHRPDAAQHTISSIIGEAERQLDVPRTVSINSVKTALSLDGALSGEELESYLELVLPPEGSSS